MKIETLIDQNVKYSDERWALLKLFREKTINLTKLFASQGIETFTFGSVARGDIKTSSDIDIILGTQIPTFRVEVILEQAQIPIIRRSIVQATPNDIIKAHIELDDDICITVILTSFTQHHFDFYKFGGCVSHQQLMENIRVPGVDKRLVLIQPTPTGHHESSIVDQPADAAQILNISVQMIEQRIRVLSRRDKIGRTGVFLNSEIRSDQSFEQALDDLAQSNSLIRRRIKK